MKRDKDIVVVRKFLTEAEAHVAQLVLEANDIPCAVLRDDAGGMLPSMSLLFPVRLVVRTEDAAEAVRILEDDEGVDESGQGPFGSGPAIPRDDEADA